MKSKTIKQWYYKHELNFILVYFPFVPEIIPKVSLLPLKLLVKKLDKYFDPETNFSQNINLSLKGISDNVVSATLILERLVKACKKDIISTGETHSINSKNVYTYVFFSDTDGNIVNIENYVKRIKDSLTFLISYYEENHKKEGSNAYANCRIFYMHLDSLHVFVSDLLHVFLSKPIK